MSPLTATVGAIRLGQSVAQQVASGLPDIDSFEKVLMSAGIGKSVSAGTPDVPADGQLKLSDVVNAIQSRLSEAGLAVPSATGPSAANPTLQLTVAEEGGWRVEGYHVNASAIEQALNQNPTLKQYAEQLRAAGGPTSISIDLTMPGGQENIQQSPGGYANWLAD